MERPIEDFPKVSFTAGRRESGGDPIAVEEPLEIRVLGKPVAVVMRTPGDDLDLVSGFVATEGIADAEDVSAIAPCVDASGAAVANVVNVSLVEGASLEVERLRRNLFAASSCGVCGKATLEAVRVRSAPVEAAWKVSARVLTELAGRCRVHQRAFEATGGLHAACLFGPKGDDPLVREDVGRHNAVDKVIGARIRAGTYPLDDRILFVTGRAGFEIVQKARVARIPVVAAVGAPSSLAIDCAREGNMTLVGFLRGDAFNVYCGEERIVD